MQNKFVLIKERLKLPDYIGKFVRLKSVGVDRFVGICPFHSEKTGSFHVNGQTNLFYCFGCGKGGDIFSFYCHMNRCDKKKALQDLAEVCGLKFEKTVFFSKLESILSFFNGFHDHLDFLSMRGVSDESIKKFKICWAPSFEEINVFITKNRLNFDKFGFKLMFFKAFQNRVVFPVWDEYGVLISFGGRCLDERDSKYVNGADSEVFHKNKILYGLNFVLDKSQIYLVEGYLDVVLMQQHGYSAVASMGTAISKHQLEKLWIHTNKIVVLLDGDDAGRKAAYKVALLALELIVPGKEIEFGFFDKDDDPASYLYDGKKIESLKFYPLYEVFFVFKSVPDNPDKKALYFKELFELSNKIEDSLLRSEYKKKWNALRWQRGFNFRVEKLKAFDFDNLILLLFKFVLECPELLDHVAEDFLKLNLKKDAELALSALLNHQKAPDLFINKVKTVHYMTFEWDFSMYLDGWYKIYRHINAQLNRDREQRLLANFSQEEWDNYCAWLKEKKELEEG